MATEQDDKVGAVRAEVHPEPDPAFWIHHTHVRMREAVEALVKEMNRLPALELGELPSVARDLIFVLDDFTKLSKAGASMQLPAGGFKPPAPPVAATRPPSDNGPVEPRIKALEDFAAQVRERLVRIETKLDTFATKDDVTGLRSEMHKMLNEQTWKIIGVAALLVTVTFWIAKNVS